MANIKKIMRTDMLVLKKDGKILDAITLLANKPHGVVIVIEAGKPIGIISESDIIKAYMDKRVNLRSSVTNIMSSPITALNSNTKLELASKIIDTKHYGSYPIVENDKLIGLIRENDVVHEINDNIRFHRNLQNLILVAFVLFVFFIFVIYQYIIPIWKFG